jgi:hypothetical protein
LVSPLTGLVIVADIQETDRVTKTQRHHQKHFASAKSFFGTKTFILVPKHLFWYQNKTFGTKTFILAPK